jgi:hypothetical protein
LDLQPPPPQVDLATGSVSSVWSEVGLFELQQPVLGMLSLQQLVFSIFVAKI